MRHMARLDLENLFSVAFHFEAPAAAQLEAPHAATNAASHWSLLNG